MDRENGVKHFKMKRDRSNSGSRGGGGRGGGREDQKYPTEWACARQSRESTCSTSNLQKCLDPPMMSNAGLMVLENVLGETKPSERHFKVAFVFRRAAWLNA